MKIRYSKYTGDDLGISAEDLLKALSDFLLESGFNTQYMPFSEWNQHTLEDLMERVRQMTPQQMESLLEKLVQKMVDEGQITVQDPQEAPGAGTGQGKDAKVRFEVTDKSLDFLGFKTLKDLLGSL